MTEYVPDFQGIIINAKIVSDNTIIGIQNNYSSSPPPPTGTPSNLPSSGTPYFVGREDTLQEVHQKLQENNQLAICAVSGMGGIGKTELAVQYAIKHKEDYSGGLCWLQGRAGDIGSQIISFALSRLGLAIPEGLEPPDQVGYCWQHWKEGQVLLVYDDVTDFHAIAPLLPPRDMSRFKVLMTSRQRAGANYNSIDLDVLDEGSALELLRSLIGNERIDAELDGAKALCAWLGYLPLGLELVGRYLKNNSTLTLVRLQERLQRAKLEAKVFADPQKGDMTAKLGVAAAFELSWGDEKLTEEAKELGCRLSLFGPAPIPWQLVEECYFGKKVWLVELIEKLREEDYQSYLERVKEEDESLEEVNDKLQDWLAQMDEAKENLELLRGKLLDRSLVQELSPGEYRLHPLIREFLQTKQIANIEDCKRDLCRVMVRISKQIPETVTLRVIETFSPSLPYLREVGEKMMDFLEDEDLIWPSEVLGRIYAFQSQFSEAEKWRKKSVKVTRDRLGERHPNVADSYNNLAVLYESMGRYEEALPLNQKALEIRLEQLGERHPDVASFYNNLASLYESMGRYEEALPLYQKALEIRIEKLGERHPNVATSYNNLASLYQSMGRNEDALPLLQQALEIRIEKLGERHPNVAYSYNNLANLYESMGRNEDALPLYQQALEIFLEQLGERHPNVATSYNNLATLYKSMGRNEDALPLHQQALEIRLEQLGTKHPDAATSYHNLAALYESMGRYGDAEQLFRKSLALRLEILPNNHPDFMRSYWCLATIAARKSDYPEAIAHYQKALSIAQESLGQDHPNTITIRNNYLLMLLESPVEEILQALPEEDREDHLQMRLKYIFLNIETLLNQLDTP